MLIGFCWAVVGMLLVCCWAVIGLYLAFLTAIPVSVLLQLEEEQFHSTQSDGVPSWLVVTGACCTSALHPCHGGCNQSLVSQCSAILCMSL